VLHETIGKGVLFKRGKLFVGENVSATPHSLFSHGEEKRIKVPVSNSLEMSRPAVFSTYLSVMV
jgi:hypothetical protein